MCLLLPHTSLAPFVACQQSPFPALSCHAHFSYRLIRVAGEFKWTVMAGIPILLLGTVLLIPFRQPETHVGLLIMTQVLIGIGSCIFSVCSELAIMAVVTH